MKKLFFLAAAVLLSGAMQARNWRINNTPEAKADFLSINDAMASADVLNGDVLYLDPGCRLTDLQTISKSVTVIGGGFNLSGDEMESSVSSINIGCNDVVLRGVNIGSCEDKAWCRTGLVVERCKIGRFGCGYSTTVQVLRCYITGSVSLGDNGRLYNNIILGSVSPGEGAIVKNNAIICYPSWTGNYVVTPEKATVVDNIIINTRENNYTIANVDPSYGNEIMGNILSTDADHVFAEHPSNSFIGATVADVFVNEGVYDELYRLKEDSPAKGAGYTGNDCGPFDGLYPYVMSCRPKNIPYIYEAIVPNRPTDNKITVTVKAKNQYE